MKTVEIKGLEVYARHGVLPQEKVNEQPFVLDISLDYDLSQAAATDDLSYAVNYAEVCKLAYDFCKNNCFNLIETLAKKISFLIAERFEKVKCVRVTVHKPKAPVGLPFGDICVSAQIEKNKIVLSLGSNLGDGKTTLDGAVKALGATRGIKIITVSDYIKTQPYGGVAKGEFTNCALTAECLLSPRELLNEIHSIEKDFGRVRKERWGDRTLDVDIIFFGDKIIAEEGLVIPHPDYFNRDFVLKPLKQIAPDFVCPLRKIRVTDM